MAELERIVVEVLRHEEVRRWSIPPNDLFTFSELNAQSGIPLPFSLWELFEQDGGYYEGWHKFIVRSLQVSNRDIDTVHLGFYKEDGKSSKSDFHQYSVIKAGATLTIDFIKKPESGEVEDFHYIILFHDHKLYAPNQVYTAYPRKELWWDEIKDIKVE